MAARIKLQRKGAKSKPFYRVVVQDQSAGRDGRVIKVLGQYDPLREPSLFSVDQEKIKSWLAKGAEPTEKVRILLGKAGLLPPIDLASLPKRKPKAQVKAEAEGKPAEGAEAKAEVRAEEEPKEGGQAEAEEKEPFDKLRAAPSEVEVFGVAQGEEEQK